MTAPEYVTVHGNGQVDHDHERHTPDVDRPDRAELAALRRDLEAAS